MNILFKKEGVIYLPKTLSDNIALLPNEVGIDKSFLAFILYLILKGQTKRKFTATRWVPLYSETLKSYEFFYKGINYGYRNHLEYLKQHQLIERSNSCSTSHKRAKGHRIKGDLLNGCYTHIPFVLSVGLAGKVSNRNEKRKNQVRKTTNHLTKWLDRGGFTIDTDRAMFYVNKEFINQPPKQIARAREILEFHNMQYSRQGKDGRLHTNFTRIPSDLRSFVAYESEILYGVDLPNSQPLLLSILLDALLRESNKEPIKKNSNVNSLARRLNKVLTKYCITTQPKTNYDERVYTVTNNLITNSKKISHALASIMSPNEFNKAGYECVNKFKTLTTNKKLYEYVGSKLLEKGIIRKKGNLYIVLLTDEDFRTPALKEYDSLKECGKEITFYALYSTLKNKNKAITAFKALFPGVFKLVDSMKDGDANAHKIFSYLLQNMESKFVLDYCTKRIAKKYPDMLLITIHDSIVTTKSKIELLKKEFELHFQSYFDLTINLLSEQW